MSQPVERLRNHLPPINKPDEVSPRAGEISPVLSSAYDRQFVNASLLQTVGAKDMLSQFNSRYFRVNAKLCEFDEMVVRPQSPKTAAEITYAEPITGYSLFWESKQQFGYADATEQTVVPVTYRVSVAMVGAREYSFNYMACADRSRLSNFTMYQFIKNHRQSNPLLLDTLSRDKNLIRVPLISANNEVMPTPFLVDQVRNWTENCLYSFYFNTFTNPRVVFQGTV